MKKKNIPIVDLTKDVVGIPLNFCLYCGTTKGLTKHHAIPRALKSKRNITFRLCKEHKDVAHPVVKTLFFPRQSRIKLNKAIVELNNALGRLKGIKVSLQTHKKKATALVPNHLPIEDIKQT